MADLPDTQQRVIDYVGSRGPRTTREVAEALGLSDSTAYYSLHVLDRKGFVERAGWATDQRYAKTWRIKATA